MHSYVCIYIYIYIHTHISLSLSRYTYTYIYVYIHIACASEEDCAKQADNADCVFLRTAIYVSLSLSLYIYTYIAILYRYHRCVYIYIYIYTHSYTYIILHYTMLYYSVYMRAPDSRSNHVRVLQSLQQPTFQQITKHQWLFSCACSYVFVSSEIMSSRLLNWFLDHPMKRDGYRCRLRLLLNKICLSQPLRNPDS